ncbi:hypothetical protein CFBP2533_25460 [Xanthomonas hortorum pv. pelargonii]|uniref:Impact N-terminal domain-containing protein n=3 Tax=Xanthomonas hortorum TaxID=56454 RepID=A0A6V7DMQ6_9XANT|nr:hypothetical protein CFBP2533_25460 [Xanthomonas hortorum pv. pelargonii]CAD0337356.1 hypothetical protein CFBP2533_25460 [Xanthomonas hortorum pv. pelargonii]
MLSDRSTAQPQRLRVTAPRPARTHRASDPSQCAAEHPADLQACNGTMAAASGTSGSHRMATMLDTLAADAHHSLDIKHSRFLANAAALESPAHALAIVQRMSVPDATHNCWAYRFGQEYRSSDDGEPSGTAGRPILAAIDGQGYDRVVVVVTRWYGGIKLGAGGLMRAYGGTAAECLRMATRRPLMTLCALELQCRFDDLGVVHVALNAFHATKLNERFDATGALLDIHIAADQLLGLKERLRDATGNRARLTGAETC